MEVMVAVVTPERTLADQLGDVLRTAPGGLFCDIDGTVAPIAPVPDQARVLPDARRALRRLRDQLDLVAMVTGRSVANARRLVRIANVAYIGNHGLEAWVGAGEAVLPEVQPWVGRIHGALTEVAYLQAEPGILLEDKGATASIHYRLSPTPAVAHRRIREALQQAPSVADLVVEEGRMVVNVLPPIPFSKGTAVRRLAELRGLQAVVYVGDDVTDVHAFDTLAELRHSGVRTLGVAVATAEAGSDVTQAADVVVRSPQEVAELLTDLAERL
jgi:trehalose 6-phosphate phosphatase